MDARKYLAFDDQCLTRSILFLNRANTAESRSTRLGVNRLGNTKSDRTTTTTTPMEKSKTEQLKALAREITEIKAELLFDWKQNPNQAPIKRLPSNGFGHYVRRKSKS